MVMQLISNQDGGASFFFSADGEKEDKGPNGDVELKETVVQMAKANGVRWYGRVLRRDDGHVLRKAMEFEVKGKRKRGRPKKTWKSQMENESKSVGLIWRRMLEMESGGWRDCFRVG